jgi:hypothetical protein
MSAETSTPNGRQYDRMSDVESYLDHAHVTKVRGDFQYDTFYGLHEQFTNLPVTLNHVNNMLSLLGQCLSLQDCWEGKGKKEFSAEYDHLNESLILKPLPGMQLTRFDIKRDLWHENFERTKQERVNSLIMRLTSADYTEVVINNRQYQLYWHDPKNGITPVKPTFERLPVRQVHPERRVNSGKLLAQKLEKYTSVTGWEGEPGLEMYMLSEQRVAFDPEQGARISRVGIYPTLSALVLTCQEVKVFLQHTEEKLDITISGEALDILGEAPTPFPAKKIAFTWTPLPRHNP